MFPTLTFPEDGNERLAEKNRLKLSSICIFNQTEFLVWIRDLVAYLMYYNLLVRSCGWCHLRTSNTYLHNVLKYFTYHANHLCYTLSHCKSCASSPGPHATRPELYCCHEDVHSFLGPGLYQCPHSLLSLRYGFSRFHSALSVWCRQHYLRMKTNPNPLCHSYRVPHSMHTCFMWIFVELIRWNYMENIGK